MRIKLDENIPLSLAGWLRNTGHDADTVRQESLTGKDDPDVWEAAQTANRFFITQDLDLKLAEQSKGSIEKQLGRPVATVIRPAATFYAAEDYHQDYYLKNPVRYK